MNKNHIDDELFEIQDAIRRAEKLDPEKSVVIRYRWPSCPRCGGNDITTRTSRKSQKIREKHAYRRCNSCGQKIILILDGDF